MDLAVAVLDLPGALADASWNGVPFYMPDSRHRTGRRVQQFFFPGVDPAQFQDLGAFDGPMRVNELLVGDLYVQYGRALEQALRTPGPGPLVHPWLGELQMVLLEPAEIVYSWRELRVVRFSATFAPYAPVSAVASNTLDAVLQDVADGVLAAQSFVSAALAPAATAMWLGAVVQDFLTTTQSYWQTVTGAGPAGATGAAGNPALSTAAGAPIAAMALAPAASDSAGFGAAVGAALAGVPAAIASASFAPQTPAVGPGDAAAPPATVPGTVTMPLLLAAATQAATQFSGLPLPAALALTQASLCVLAAIRAATTIAWASAQDAQAALAQLLAALDAVATQAAAAAVPTVSTTVLAVQAAELWTALQTARADLVADMTATIGRLPQVRSVALARPLPAWLVANIIAGDEPSLIQPTYADLLARNRVPNPAQMAAGVAEVLAPTAIASLVPGSVAA